jgi:hypothetical protein
MHCQYCGAQLRSRARFCNHCGKTVVERFGSAVLPAPAAAVPDTPTENLSPKARTAQNPPAPSTLEGQPQPSTDQLGLRGTGRQLHAKSTSEERVPKLDVRTTVVDAKAWREAAPTMPEPTATPLHAATVVVEPPTTPLPPPPPPVRASAPLPVAPAEPVNVASAREEAVYLALDTEQLQHEAANKPFFTRMLTPGENRQHKYLIYAVPFVLLAAIIVFFIAFYVLR